MKKPAYLEFHREFRDDMFQITAKKNADYTGKSDDPFDNLRNCERRGWASAGMGILIRMDDKMSRLGALVDGTAPAVKAESFRDACIDLANYAALLAAWYEDRGYHQAATQFFGTDGTGKNLGDTRIYDPAPPAGSTVAVGETASPTNSELSENRTIFSPDSKCPYCHLKIDATPGAVHFCGRMQQATNEPDPLA
jgi:hypothetical protein